jgi:site-specific recombinase XerD
VSEAIGLYLRDLEAASAAAKTVSAYRRDLTELAVWAGANDLTPVTVGYRELRRYVAGLSVAARHPPPARKLAATRGLYVHAPGGDGQPESRRPDLGSQAESKLPQVLTVRQMESLLAGGGSRHSLELRDRRCLELAYSCGLRSEEVITVRTDSIDFDDETINVIGRAKQRLLPVGEPARQAVEAYLAKGRPSLVTTPPRRRCSCPATAAGCHLRT